MDQFTTYGRIMDFTSDTIWKRVPWAHKDPIRQIISNNCHWGQLKLFYTELEFLNICIERKYNMKDSVLIYIGAAPGTHIIYLKQLFPDLHWILIDPNKFHISQSDKISIYTGSAGFFKDEMIPELLEHPFVQLSKYVLFISDIRTNPAEQVVFNEMLDQQRWLLKLRADMSMLKFRLPYTIPNGQKIWTYDIDTIEKYIKKPTGRPCTHKEYNVCYLKGDIYIQLFPPQYSTETRLIVDRKKDKYKMFNYDTIKYEEKCFYYNTIIRNIKLIYKNSTELKNHVIGCNDNYETCSEYMIVESYSNDFNEVCQMIYDIHEFHSTINTLVSGTVFNKSLAMCKMFTIYKEKFPSLEVFITNMKRKELTQDQIILLFESITNIYEEATKFNHYQLDTFKNGTLLNEEHYKKQIKLLNEGLRANELIYDILSSYIS